MSRFSSTPMVDETPTARAALLRWCDYKRRELDPLAMRQMAFLGKSLTFQSTTTASAPSSSSSSASSPSVDIRRACRLEIPRRQSFEPKVTIESTYTCEVQRSGGGTLSPLPSFFMIAQMRVGDVITGSA